MTGRRWVRYLSLLGPYLAIVLVVAVGFWRIDIALADTCTRTNDRAVLIIGYVEYVIGLDGEVDDGEAEALAEAERTFAPLDCS